MLGKGLESLIPPQQNNNLNNEQPSQQNKVGEDQTSRQNLNSEPVLQTEQNFIPEVKISEPIIEEQKPKIENEKSIIDHVLKFHPKKNYESEAIFHIEVEKIKPNPHQPRRVFEEEPLRELAASIMEYGVIQPLVVVKIEKEVESGTEIEYQLIAGERRLMAAKIAGLERVPAIIRKISHQSEQMEVAIVENLQRANFNPIETARAYAKLQEKFGLTQREIAQRLGKSRETVNNTLRLLNLPNEMQDALGNGQINESQARFLLAMSDLAAQKNLFEELLNKNLSVRELRKRVNKSTNLNNEQAEEKNEKIDPEIDYLQGQLTELLGAKVKIEKTDKEGKIIITFYSPEEIKGIITKLGSSNRQKEDIDPEFHL